MANIRSGVQFINSSYPRDTFSVKVQRKVHSHAARVAHAKARQLCIIDYQAAKIRQTPEDSQDVEEQGRRPTDRALSVSHAGETKTPVVPSPINLLGSDRRDPFHCFARPFEPIEHFLLDHCESF